MKIILFILAIGAAFFIISMIIMWYVLVFAVMLLGFIAGATYWLTAMLLDGVVQDPQIWAVSAAVAVFIGIGYLGVSSDRVKNTKSSR
jgi:bacteriorhodopsin